MDAPQMLSDDNFSHVVRSAPLVSIDIVIRDAEGRTLVGLRLNEPAKGTYFVPGGVIRKNESIRRAFKRILKTETGIDASFDEARLIGAFDHFYPTNRFGHSGYGTHYVALAHELVLRARPTIMIDSQHSETKWMSDAEMLSATNVHANTKAYVGRSPK
jgi:colanic acid biosynthesis protein WcaH